LNKTLPTPGNLPSVHTIMVNALFQVPWFKKHCMDAMEDKNLTQERMMGLQKILQTSIIYPGTKAQLTRIGTSKP
jgi:hypothetical protein